MTESILMETQERTYRHWLFGTITVKRIGGSLFFPALRCARKLLFLMPQRALIQSGALYGYSLENGRLSKDAMVEGHDLWKLIFRCKHRRPLLAKSFYNWIYDTVYPDMFEHNPVMQIAEHISDDIRRTHDA